MYDHQTQGEFFYAMLYGAVAMMSLMACCYLLFRRSNAVAPDVTSSVRLRRWTATFFACIALSHIWYLPIFFLSSNEEIMLNYFVGALLDFMTLIPSAIALLLVMLQDRRRPLWPICVIVAPPIVVLAVGFASRSLALLPLLYVYYLLLGSGLIIYMVHEVRRYGRWLRDNYADLEHKEVWLSLVVIVILLLILAIYSVSNYGIFIQTFIQFSEIFILAFIFWRVETLQTLHAPQADTETVELSDDASNGDTKDGAEAGAAVTLPANISQLLKQYCEDTRLYLQHDITRDDLSKAVGTNRSYLSLYFAQQGETYNSYINKLRIQHFVNDYREAIATKRPFTAQQLAHESGFGSYATFGRAFKQTMGQTVTEWMKDEA